MLRLLLAWLIIQKVIKLDEAEYILEQLKEKQIPATIKETIENIKKTRKEFKKSKKEVCH